jgi:hypothetical protein
VRAAQIRKRVVKLEGQICPNGSRQVTLEALLVAVAERQATVSRLGRWGRSAAKSSKNRTSEDICRHLIASFSLN